MNFDAIGSGLVKLVLVESRDAQKLQFDGTGGMRLPMPLCRENKACHRSALEPELRKRRTAGA